MARDVGTTRRPMSVEQITRRITNDRHRVGDRVTVAWTRPSGTRGTNTVGVTTGELNRTVGELLDDGRTDIVVIDRRNNRYPVVDDRAVKVNRSVAE